MEDKFLKVDRSLIITYGPSTGLVLCELMNQERLHTDNEGWFFMPYHKIREALGFGHTTVQQSINTLRNAGLLKTRMERRQNNRIWFKLSHNVVSFPSSKSTGIRLSVNRNPAFGQPESGTQSTEDNIEELDKVRNSINGISTDFQSGDLPFQDEAVLGSEQHLPMAVGASTRTPYEQPKPTTAPLPHPEGRSRTPYESPTTTPTPAVRRRAAAPPPDEADPYASLSKPSRTKVRKPLEPVVMTGNFETVLKLWNEHGVKHALTSRAVHEGKKMFEQAIRGTLFTGKTGVPEEAKRAFTVAEITTAIVRFGTKRNSADHYPMKKDYIKKVSIASFFYEPRSTAQCKSMFWECLAQEPKRIASVDGVPVPEQGAHPDVSDPKINKAVLESLQSVAPPGTMITPRDARYCLIEMDKWYRDYHKNIWMRDADRTKRFWQLMTRMLDFLRERDPGRKPWKPTGSLFKQNFFKDEFYTYLRQFNEANKQCHWSDLR